MKKSVVVAICTVCRRRWNGNMLAGEGPFLRKNVHTASTSTSRPTTFPPSKRTSMAIFHSAYRRKGNTWADQRESARTHRTSWGCAICMATWSNGAPTYTIRRIRRWPGIMYSAAAAGSTPTCSVGQGTAARVGRTGGSTTTGFALSQFPALEPSKTSHRRSDRSGGNGAGRSGGGCRRERRRYPLCRIHRDWLLLTGNSAILKSRFFQCAHDCQRRRSTGTTILAHEQT